MKKLVTFLGIIACCILLNPAEAFAQLFQQDFSGALTAGNAGSGNTITNDRVYVDPVYADSGNASTSQFTYLATNNAAASIELTGDGVMRLIRGGSGTVYIVRNANFAGSPEAVKVSFDFNTEVNTGNSSSAIQFMLGTDFPNSNNEPSGSNKHSRFFINTKQQPSATWGVTAESGSSESAYTTTEKIIWVVNNSGAALNYSAPDGSTESVANDSYDVWIGNTKEIDDAPAITADTPLNNFEIRIAGGNGIYTIDNLLIEEVTPAVTHNFYRSKANGNWDDTATWESSEDGNTWADAASIPSGSESITITDTVTVNTAVTITGYVKIEGDGNFTVGTGSVTFGDGSTYEHARNGGSIPIATWGNNSTAVFNAITNTMPGNRSQSFYNIIWDCPDQAGNYNMGFDDDTIGGDIIINNTGSSRWYLCGPASLDTVSVTIMGDLILNAGNFAAHGTGNAATSVTVHLHGNVVASSGNFSVARGSQGGTGTTDFFVHGDFTLTDVTTQNSNSSGAKFIFAGGTAQNVNLTNVEFGGGGLPVQVLSGSTVNLGTSQIGGNGSFIVDAGAGLATGNAGGLDSALQTTGSKNLSTQGSYTFNGSTGQITGSMLPLTIENLTINNAAGVVLSGNVTVDGILNLISGDLDLNGNIITLGASAALFEPNNNTVKGASGKITTTRNLGTPSGINPGGIGIEITADKDLGTTTIERYHSAPVGGGNQGILRYYNIQPGQNNSGLNATLKFHYDESELNSIAETDLTLFKSGTGADNSWVHAGGSVNPGENYIEISGVESFSYWAAAGISAPIPVELTSFSAVVQEKRVLINWSTATETQNYGWEIERKSTADNWSKIAFVPGKVNSTETSYYSFTDKEVLISKIQYRLKQIDLDGTFTYSSTIEVDVNNVPDNFALHQNYPNPFNPSTTINFDLPEEAFVNLTIFNALGEKVMTLINQKMDQGYYSEILNADNLNSGMYFYRLQVNDLIFTKKMMLIK